MNEQRTKLSIREMKRGNNDKKTEEGKKSMEKKEGMEGK